MPYSIPLLLIDDDLHRRRVLDGLLTRCGYRVHTAEHGRQALALLATTPVALVLAELRLPVLDGVGLVQALAAAGQAVPTLLVCGQADRDVAEHAVALGAGGYLVRPFTAQGLERAIEQVLPPPSAGPATLAPVVPDDFCGDSVAMLRVFDQIARVGPTRATVLLTGETGTGKELAARALHRASDRADKPFVAVNCAALPAEMVESELFGHDKGAFTGAVRDRIGKFELASRGTLFLDEITEMPMALQAKLLRVLQEGRLEPLGSNRQVALDVRVLAACNRDPLEAVRQGRLREDLYYRLQVFTLSLPPLRQRRADLPVLLQHLAARQGRRVAWSAAALACLQAHDWPGNVRELDNVVQRALVLCDGPVVGVAHLPEGLQAASAGSVTGRVTEPLTRHAAPPPLTTLTGLPAQGLSLGPAVERLERHYIAEALRRTGDNKRQAAALLGLSERTLWYKLGRARADAAALSPGPVASTPAPRP